MGSQPRSPGSFGQFRRDARRRLAADDRVDHDGSSLTEARRLAQPSGPRRGYGLPVGEARARWLLPPPSVPALPSASARGAVVASRSDSGRCSWPGGNTFTTMRASVAARATPSRSIGRGVWSYPRKNLGPDSRVLHGARFARMPTPQPRHSITETAAPAAALEPVRARLGAGIPASAELVARGAEANDRAEADGLRTFVSRLCTGPQPDLGEIGRIRRASRL